MVVQRAVRVVDQRPQLRAQSPRHAVQPQLVPVQLQQWRRRQRVLSVPDAAAAGHVPDFGDAAQHADTVRVQHPRQLVARVQPAEFAGVGRVPGRHDGAAGGARLCRRRLPPQRHQARNQGGRGGRRRRGGFCQSAPFSQLMDSLQIHR